MDVILKTFLFSFTLIVGKTVHGTSEFMCTSGSIINIDSVCNGKADCEDASDENKDLCYKFLCPAEYIRCQYGACILKTQKCDGKSDCIDQSDESQCGFKDFLTRTCRFTEFLCRNGDCIESNKICNGKNDCIDGSDEEAYLCNHNLCPTTTFRCRYGACLHKDVYCDREIDCMDGSDEIQCQNKSVICSPILLKNINAKCMLNHRKVSCEKNIKPNTIVKYTCAKNYIPFDTWSHNYETSTCQKNGVWSRDILKCQPDCGRSIKKLHPSIFHGWKPAFKFPWFVQLNVKIGNEWKIWCGGSIIANTIIITAGHCVWQIKPNEVEVEINSKKYKIREIIKHPLYLDRNGNYNSDIALLKLNESISFSPSIRPICIDWKKTDSSSQLKEGIIGQIMGTGVNENTTSGILFGINLPVISNINCMSMQSKDFKKFVSITTFCAGWGNGSSVCNGDSGSGLVFLMDNNQRYVLQGIVSLSPRKPSTSLCDPFKFTIFTRISSYLDWILSEVRDTLQ